MFFILVPFLKRAPCIIIHLARDAEKGGGVLMSIILPNLNHSFVPDSGFRIPDSGSGSGSGFRIRFRIPDFRIFHTPFTNTLRTMIVIVINALPLFQRSRFSLPDVSYPRTVRTQTIRTQHGRFVPRQFRCFELT